MAIRTKSLDEMIREIIASLQSGADGRPAFTLLVGSGFSFPIIPTPTQMLNGDIAWWRYTKTQKLRGPFRHRAECIAAGVAKQADLAEFERVMWKEVQAKAAGSELTAFPLTAEGLPDLTNPEAIGLAYQAVMADGLLNNKMRRQYLRDAIERSYPKVNGAHIFLAGILEAQETWAWGAPLCRTIFTTNFDPLLQRSLQLVNKLYYMTDRPEVLEPPDDDESTAIHLVYTHGSVHRYELLNTGDQIDHAAKQNAPTLIDYFRRHGVIVMGYSGWRDTTMEALLSCPSFDSNLYWCDLPSAVDAETRLRPEVLKILQAREKNAYYVPISGADEAMHLLHRELRLGDVPKFILAPVATMIAQLKSIEVPSAPAVASKGEATTQLSSTSLATLLAGTLTRLDVAKSAFDNPKIVQPESAQGQKDVARALTAQLLSDAFVAHSKGEFDKAMALWSAVIAALGVPGEDRAVAFYSRGVAMSMKNEKTKAIDDYTSVIEMPDASAEQKAMALINRGIEWGNLGDTTKELADYASINEMPDVPAAQRAKAFLNRGWLFFIDHNDTRSLVDDSQRALELDEANLAARSNLALGFLLTGDAGAAGIEYEALLSRTSDPAPIQTAIDDLEAALSKQPEIREAAKILDRLRSALPAEDKS